MSLIFFCKVKLAWNKMDSKRQISPQSSVVRHVEGGINEMSKVFGKIW